MRLALAAGLAAVLVTSVACSSDPEPSTAPASSPPATSAGPAPTSAPTSAPAPAAGPQVITTGLDAPWGLAFLPGGGALVSERDSGRIVQVGADGGAPREVARIRDVAAAGEGGLLGLAVSPAYRTDGLVYAYYTTAQDNRIVRFRLGQDPQPIVTGIPKGTIHNGGRLAFGPDGSLYAGTGENGDGRQAQDPSTLAGKILRMTPAGKPVAGARSLVLSTGHRNVQGLAFDERGRLYASEFGQDRFDEVNQVTAGDNDGWPQVEGAGTGGGRFVAPIVTWTTDEASPSGVAIVGRTLYVAALRGQRLWQVPLDGRGGAGEPVALLQGDYGRIRTVAAAPDGSLWVITSNTDGRGQPGDGDDRILRMAPPAAA